MATKKKSIDYHFTRRKTVQLCSLMSKDNENDIKKTVETI